MVKAKWIAFEPQGKTDSKWGYTDKTALEKSLAELQAHVGEEVLVYGGGGYGTNLATLQGARIEVWSNFDSQQGERWGIKADLLMGKGNKNFTNKQFDPWLDSWAIAFKGGK